MDLIPVFGTCVVVVCDKTKIAILTFWLSGDSVSVNCLVGSLPARLSARLSVSAAIV